MNRLLSWIRKRADEHLSDEQIIADIESDAAGSLPVTAGRHLRSCWQCLARRQQLQSITFRLVEYQQAVLTPFLPPPPNAEERLLRALDQEAAQAQPGSAARPALRLWMHSLSPQGAIIASMCAVGAAILVAVATHPRGSPPMLPVDFLRQAAAADHSLDQRGTGVVRQRIRIQASGQAVERTLYRDLQGHRHPKVPATTPVAGELRTELTAAGVDWDAPLSTTSFAGWHDHSIIQGDEVARTGEDLLTLTTKVADPEVASESLTVRKSDFHPIARTVHLRDAGTIEIAELDYSVSGWNAANDAAFSPAEPRASPVPTPVVVASLPTPEELDQAELEARLAIGQDAAASSEALAFTRSGRGIHVHGAVGTEERKHELLARLRTVPHVTASIFSIQELSASVATGETGATSTEGPTSTPGISSLTALFQRQSRSPKEASFASRQVLVAMLAVQQESSAISDLMRRFEPGAHLTDTARDALAELLTEHRQRLDDALTEEERLVRPMLGVSHSSLDAKPTAQATGRRTLAAASASNRILCNELVSGSPPSPRSADTIAADILIALEDVRQSAAATGSATVHELSERK